jgi:hypothetical protein
MNKPHHTWSDSPIHEQIRAMNDTPTPETDKHEFPCMTWPSRDHPMVVRVEFARKLERERDEAREQGNDMREKWLAKGQCCEYLGAELHEAINQRDRLAEEIKMLKTNLEVSFRQTEQAVQDRAEEHKTITAQRDRLAEALKEYREALSDGPENCSYKMYEAVDEFAEQALQSLTPNTEP